MTAIQICALIGLIIGAALLYWTGYRDGLLDGRISAGIIAPLSATAEALIPHEKLREAATPDATLIAQNRPSAQPAVGYTQVQAVTIVLEAA
ncbi:hypothetical protein [Pseudomonas sp. SG20052]|uniref:hypothetical protein n=1 Tax=Pseudomonas sp. SG20052 TaxID=3074147 RepID=UPI00287F3F0E|nr:hypothetical protein [Pseudomonas sp. SG20052]WNF53015.1 hypothetical protein RHP74_16710 [Pseudomonas sp. SG20052]